MYCKQSPLKRKSALSFFLDSFSCLNPVTPENPIEPSQDNRGVVYGTDRGTLGHLALAPDRANFLKKTWELPAGGGSDAARGGGGGGGGRGRGVTSLKACDLTQDGVQELVAGREDGTITVRRGTGKRGVVPSSTNPPSACFSLSLRMESVLLVCCTHVMLRICNPKEN